MLLPASRCLLQRTRVGAPTQRSGGFCLLNTPKRSTRTKKATSSPPLGQARHGPLFSSSSSPRRDRSFRFGARKKHHRQRLSASAIRQKARIYTIPRRCHAPHVVSLTSTGTTAELPTLTQLFISMTMSPRLAPRLRLVRAVVDVNASARDATSLRITPLERPLTVTRHVEERARSQRVGERARPTDRITRAPPPNCKQSRARHPATDDAR